MGGLRCKTLQPVVHRPSVGEKMACPKRGFAPGRSSQLKFPLVARMSWRGLGGSSREPSRRGRPAGADAAPARRLGAGLGHCAHRGLYPPPCLQVGAAVSRRRPSRRGRHTPGGGRCPLHTCAPAATRGRRTHPPADRGTDARGPCTVRVGDRRGRRIAPPICRSCEGFPPRPALAVTKGVPFATPRPAIQSP